MKWVRNLSVFLAGAFLLLHTMLPHQHHSELNQVAHVAQHDTAHNLLDYLKLAFHFDPGEGHLEKFQTAQYTFDTFNNALGQSIRPPLPVNCPEKKIFFLEIDFDTSSRLLVSQLQFRGPPHLG